MRPRSSRLRLAALMGGAGFGVHQGRYLIGYGHDGASALAGQGHAYLAVAGPLLAGLLLLACVDLLGRVAAGGPRERRPRLARLWLGATAALLTAYCVQELVEGSLASGHPGGLAGVVGHGGWLALPIAAIAGLAVALAARGAAAATDARRATRPWRPPALLAPVAELAAPAAPFVPRPRPVAAAPRAPPALP